MLDSFVPLGVIRHPHGVRGEVKIVSFTTPSDALFSYALTDETGRAITLTRTGTQPEWFVCRIAGVEDRTAAEALKNREIGVPRSALPAPEEGTLLISDLVGCAVYDTSRLPIGTVRDVVNYGASDIIVLDTMDGELMLPFTDAFFPAMDLSARILTCDMPEMVAAPPAQADLTDE